LKIFRHKGEAMTKKEQEIIDNWKIACEDYDDAVIELVQKRVDLNKAATEIRNYGKFYKEILREVAIKQILARTV
jgi:hypothetical protein